MAHIVVEAAALTADISHTPDIVGKLARPHWGCLLVDLGSEVLLTWWPPLFGAGDWGPRLPMQLLSPRSKPGLGRAEASCISSPGQGLQEDQALGTRRCPDRKREAHGLGSPRIHLGLEESSLCASSRAGYSPAVPLDYL